MFRLLQNMFRYFQKILFDNNITINGRNANVISVNGYNGSHYINYSLLDCICFDDDFITRHSIDAIINNLNTQKNKFRPTVIYY